MKSPLFYALTASCLLISGCKPYQTPADERPEKVQEAKEDKEIIPAQGGLFVTPPALLSDASFDLIVKYEVGGEAYYNMTQRFPEWPKGQSGVTWAIGYDGGYHTQSGIKADWSNRIEDDFISRLSKVAGITGSEASALLRTVKDIEIKWPAATGEFREIEVANEYALTKRTFPGFENLRPNAQGALIALVYNRGSALTGTTRIDMLVIRRLVSQKDYSGMAEALRHIPVTMYSNWTKAGIYKGLKARYDETAQLMETP